MSRSGSVGSRQGPSSERALPTARRAEHGAKDDGWPRRDPGKQQAAGDSRERRQIDPRVVVGDLGGDQHGPHAALNDAGHKKQRHLQVAVASAALSARGPSLHRVGGIGSWGLGHSHGYSTTPVAPFASVGERRVVGEAFQRCCRSSLPERQPARPRPGQPWRIGGGSCLLRGLKAISYFQAITRAHDARAFFRGAYSIVVLRH
jgi:hypothetical protein